MVIRLIILWRRNRMTRKAFTQKPNYWTPTDKLEAVRMYNKSECSISKIALHFKCTREKVERMLKSQGYL